MLRFTKREEMILLVIIITLVIGSGIIAVNYFTDKKSEKAFVADNTAKKSVESKEEKLEQKQQSEDKELDEILVQVGGEINQPGVYKLREGSRIFQLLDKAGGITSKADLDQMNLVKELKDGEKIIVPKEVTTEKKTAIQGDNQKKTEQDKINLNTATKNELQQLYRIGPALSDRIIEYRNQHGGFNKISELKEVSRIGEKIFQENKERLTVR
ncbi:helix-hairpin-helix domain-containing protein [Acetohalobium arabaticum]|uniref:Competence protein ComEA helix-hairpin-helix repeat protein n=1 Tax=Acetohalobium arabaticum (strain ATCC 49924 / DSM 5501 / Z-7288) TaxID=574087 RepID=D9QV66_ACEAZ|nr:helix-hairpin-helix domain-containing protein [Acetohalobium arabaticum]ADL12125.1 competence protein ComEA helix-hairpin-helix repeat protein [Acetohalobium arabaticum DSM 5501]